MRKNDYIRPNLIESSIKTFFRQVIKSSLTSTGKRKEKFYSPVTKSRWWNLSSDLRNHLSDQREKRYSRACASKREKQNFSENSEFLFGCDKKMMVGVSQAIIDFTSSINGKYRCVECVRSLKRNN